MAHSQVEATLGVDVQDALKIPMQLNSTKDDFIEDDFIDDDEEEEFTGIKCSMTFGEDARSTPFGQNVFKVFIDLGLISANCCEFIFELVALHPGPGKVTQTRFFVPSPLDVTDTLVLDNEQVDRLRDAMYKVLAQDNKVNA